jgi:hypothetical protein
MHAQLGRSVYVKAEKEVTCLLQPALITFAVVAGEGDFGVQDIPLETSKSRLELSLYLQAD